MTITNTAYKVAPTDDDHDVTYVVTVTLDGTTTTREITVHYDKSRNEHRMDTVTNMAAAQDYLSAAANSFSPDTFTFGKFTPVITAGSASAAHTATAADVVITAVDYKEALADRDTKDPVVTVDFKIGRAVKSFDVQLHFAISNNQYHLDQFDENSISINTAEVAESDT